MKKLLVFSLLLATTICANAQILRTEELEEYAKERYGEKWVNAAENLSDSLTLDKNNSLCYVRIIDCGNTTKEKLYLILNYWFTMTFNDANAVIKLNDKESGCIIGQGYLHNIAVHTGGMSSYGVSARPILKVDIKDGKIRVTYTVQNYEVSRMVGGGWMAAVAGGVRPTQVQEHWVLEECFPFASKDKHKKTSCKALIMVHAYSNVILDKLEEAVRNGLSGNENDEW